MSRFGASETKNNWLVRKIKTSLIMPYFFILVFFKSFSLSFMIKIYDIAFALMEKARLETP